MGAAPYTGASPWRTTSPEAWIPPANTCDVRLEMKPWGMPMPPESADLICVNREWESEKTQTHTEQLRRAKLDVADGSLGRGQGLSSRQAPTSAAPMWPGSAGLSQPGDRAFACSRTRVLERLHEPGPPLSSVPCPSFWAPVSPSEPTSPGMGSCPLCLLRPFQL